MLSMSAMYSRQIWYNSICSSGEMNLEASGNSVGESKGSPNLEKLEFCLNAVPPAQIACDNRGSVRLIPCKERCEPVKSVLLCRCIRLCKFAYDSFA